MYRTLFPSEKAYRVATVLYACCKDKQEILLPDLAYIAKINYFVVLYWINIFEICGFIRVTRYRNRANALGNSNRHVIVHLNNKKTLANLYNYMWLQKWEEQFCVSLS